ncbi:MAG TPA: CPBP family glutamic-type intramembrane protease [Gaiellaceae bacterium]|jgi:membrane protease YdiL (CAAX protease family)|nr:CPBP family glutamic-type intramembrane protease [Gaiellaceae bacterium]
MPERAPGATSGRLAAWLALVGVLAALAYASYLVADERDTADFFYRWDTFIGGVVQDGVLLGLLLLIVRGGPGRVLLALRRPPSWLQAAGLMVVVLIAIWILGAVLEPFLHAGDEQGLVPKKWRPEEAAPFAANLAFTVLAVPVVEELMFRGAGFSLLAARYGTAVAIVGTAVLFGAVHGLVFALPLLVAFGIGLAWLRSTTGSVYPGMILHGVFNGLVILLGVAA